MKKFEFILRINGNIICQRYFAVKNFNPKTVWSLITIECVEDCVAIVIKGVHRFQCCVCVVT